MLEKMNNAGLQKIIDEKQAQLDAWAAARQDGTKPKKRTDEAEEALPVLFFRIIMQKPYPRNSLGVTPVKRLNCLEK